MALAAGRYMRVRAAHDAGGNAVEEEVRLAESLRACAAQNNARRPDRADYFAGRLRPDDWEGLRKVFLDGEGNARDSLTQTYRFWSAVLLPDMLGPARREDWEGLAEEAGLSVPACRALQHAACKSAVAGAWQLDPVAASECRWLPTFALRQAMRDRAGGPFPGLGDPAALSDRTAAEFEALGGALDGRCDREASARGPGLLPWLAAAKTLRLKGEHPWVSQARAAGAPLVGGLSHSAAKYRLIAAQLCGPEARSAWVDALCFVAYLVPIESHSIHEVLSALAIVDPHLSAYEACHAAQVAGCSPDELLRRCPFAQQEQMHG